MLTIGSTGNVACATLAVASIAYVGGTKSLNDVLFGYVQERLRQETATRGKQAQIARDADIASPTITNILKGERGIGLDSLLKLLGYWKMTLADLEAVATDQSPESRKTLADKVAAYAQALGINASAIRVVLDREPNHDAHDELWWFDHFHAEYKRELRGMREEYERARAGKRKASKSKPAKTAQTIERAPKSRRATGST